MAYLKGQVIGAAKPGCGGLEKPWERDNKADLSQSQPWPQRAIWLQCTWESGPGSTISMHSHQYLVFLGSCANGSTKQILFYSLSVLWLHFKASNQAEVPLLERWASDSILLHCTFSIKDQNSFVNLGNSLHFSVPYTVCETRVTLPHWGAVNVIHAQSSLCLSCIQILQWWETEKHLNINLRGLGLVLRCWSSPRWMHLSPSCTEEMEVLCHLGNSISATSRSRGEALQTIDSLG